MGAAPPSLPPLLMADRSVGVVDFRYIFGVIRFRLSADLYRVVDDKRAWRVLAGFARTQKVGFAKCDIIFKIIPTDRAAMLLTTFPSSSNHENPE